MDVRILIVDDHHTVRESLRFVFAATGISQIMEATTPQQAVQVLQDHDVELILLDLMLRDGHGQEALREIKALDESIPVLIHSFHDSPQLLSRAFRLGAAGYVVKGRDKNALIYAVRQAAAGRSIWTAEQMARIRDLDIELGECDAAPLAESAGPE